MAQVDSLRSPTGLRILTETVEELGHPVEACLAGTALKNEDLYRDTTRVTPAQEICGIANAINLFPDAFGLGLRVGKKLHVNSFGIWGFGILTSPTLRVAIETAVAFQRVTCAILPFDIVETDDSLKLNFSFEALPETVRIYMLESYAMIAAGFLAELFQDEAFGEFSIETSIRNDKCLKRLSKLLGVEVYGGKNTNAIVIPSDLLDQPLVKCDPVTHKFCIERCQAALKKIETRSAQWTSRVEEILLENIAEDRKIDEVAERLCVTPRTLRRRLANEGRNFREIYTDARLGVAHQMLETSQQSVEVISWKVGYSEPASFVRAFSKKFGQTPTCTRV